MAQIVQDSTEQLAQYIKYLESEGLVDFDILEDNDRCIQNRFKIQKYVFLARQFGLDLPFEVEWYIHGPYSESLADQYYEMAENRQDLYDPVRPDLPQGFDSGGFLDFVRGRSYDWLEVAATLIDFNGRGDGIYRDRSRLAEKIKSVDYALRHMVPEVLDDVERAGLVRLSS